MKKGLNIRLYLNLKQQKLAEKTFGATRFVYNHVLGLKKELWEDYKLSYTPKLAGFKEEWNWLCKIPSQALANAYMDCMNSFKNFFNGKSNKSKNKQAYPKFHKKGKCRDSFRIACTYNKKNVGDIRILDKNHIQIPKFGKITFAGYNDLDWTKVHVFNITISKSKVGNYYGSICVDIDEPDYIEPKFTETAFDLGLKDFAIFDSGDVVENPKFFRKSEKKLAKEQRLLSKMIKGSNNYNEKKLKIAKIHEKIKNQRKDFQHKISHRIVIENQNIYSEDLKPSNMLKNHKLAKSIQDAAFGSFCNMISYKSLMYHRNYIKIGTFFPSSKICHRCGIKYRELKLSERFWTCENCGTYLDRDENAALNILKEGQRIFQSTVGNTESLGKYPSKPIDTGLVTNLESELLSNPSIEGPLL
jgi:putative transposase